MSNTNINPTSTHARCIRDVLFIKMQRKHDMFLGGFLGKGSYNDNNTYIKDNINITNNNNNIAANICVYVYNLLFPPTNIPLNMCQKTLFSGKAERIRNKKMRKERMETIMV